MDGKNSGDLNHYPALREVGAVVPEPPISDRSTNQMARITVEDCLEYVDNRFDLVLLATKRARQLTHGVEPLLPWENDRPTVMALREIAAGTLSAESIAATEPQEEDAIKSPERAFAEELLTVDVRGGMSE